MEETMKAVGESIVSLLMEARKPGDELPPTYLLSAVSQHPDPFKAFSDNNLFQIFRGEIHKQFGFIPTDVLEYEHLSADAIGKVASLLRWITRELREWRVDGDKNDGKLTALFVSIIYCQLGEDFWALLPTDLENNTDILKRLSYLISGLKLSYTAISKNVPIWEREIIEAFAKADADKNWPAIERIWISLAGANMPNSFVVQASHCLFKFGFPYLINGLDNLHQTAIAMQVVGPFSIEQKFRIGESSKNHYIQFSCLYQAITQSGAELSIEGIKLAPSMIAKMADDGENWKKLMLALNRNPSRYPTLYIILGYSLASITAEAMKSFIDSITPLSSNDSVVLVSKCFRVFHKSASIDTRRSLWKLAYERWEKWQHELISNEDTLQIDIPRSNFDYAVVGYVIECMEASEKERKLTTVTEKIGTLNKIWNNSVDDYRSKLNIFLSEFQIYSHANKVAMSPTDWMPQINYFPDNVRDNDYAAIMNGYK